MALGSPSCMAAWRFLSFCRMAENAESLIILANPKDGLRGAEKETGHTDDSAMLGRKVSSIQPRVVLIGDSRVGKTTILNRITTHAFNDSEPAILLGSSEICVQHVHGFTIELPLWDTAGQERFRSIGQSKRGCCDRPLRQHLEHQIRPVGAANPELS
jgi:hypothetical protein